MIDELVPGNVVSVETRQDLVETQLFPEEEESLGRAVESRRREFITGRACARLALDQLGFAPAPIASGSRGEPLWPAGVIGSITHCRGYRACAVASRDEIASIGIDAEVHEPLPEGILETVSSPLERRRIAGTGGGACIDRVLFSAKEAVYKAWFPLTGKWLDFDEVELSVTNSAFGARFLVAGPVVDGERITHFEGRWRTDKDILLTAVVVARRYAS